MRPDLLTSAAHTTTLEPPRAKPQPWYLYPYLPLLVCLLIALLLRVWLIVHTQGVLDGDEAMTGIQAEGILRGEHPIYFYSQAYMGSLEAYLIAGLFALFGPSVWALRAEPVMLSLAVVWASWRFASSLAGAARLPARERQYFRVLVALCAAIVPLYDAVVELRALGGYIETFLLMLLLLDATLRLTQRWLVSGHDKPARGDLRPSVPTSVEGSGRAAITVRELLWRWAWIGVLVGLGFWIDPLVISAVFVAAVWIVGYCLVALLPHIGASSSRVGGPLTGLWGRGLVDQTEASKGSSYAGEPWPIRRNNVLKGLGAALVALPAACVGGSPALVWGAEHNWENIAFLVYRSNGFSLHTMHILSNLYFDCVAPRVVGGALPGERPLLLLLHALPLALGLCCIAISVLLIGCSLIWPHPVLVQMRALVLLPALFAAATYFFFLKSWGPEFCYNRDTIGRYATPLALMLPFFIAALFTFWQVVLRRAVGSPPLRGPVSLSENATPARAPSRGATLQQTTLQQTTLQGNEGSQPGWWALGSLPVARGKILRGAQGLLVVPLLV
ncbi:MAG TPA: hypothetical protein VKR06_09990, partial [Ktedonosporobacter sp.]|nr:hypothetical protein [Ktedonosporobacter sp.]